MNVSTVIREVQIYRSRGTVIRKGNIHLSKGINTIEISGMSTSALIDTVKIKLPAHVKEFAYRISEGNTGEKTNDVSKKIRRAESKIEALRTQSEMWKANGAFTSLKDMTVKEMEAYIKAFPWRIEEIENRILDLMDEKARLEKELNKAVDEERRPVVIVEIISENETECPVELSYHDSSIFWTPAYEMHTDGEHNTALFRIKAAICQHTGENWNQVHITLRTGDHANISTPPKIDPVWLDFRHSGSMAPSACFGSEESSALFDINNDDTLRDTAQHSFQPLYMDDVNINSEETTTEYILPAAYNVLSGRENTVNIEIFEFSVPCNYARRAYPKFNKAVYLFADMREEDIPVSMNRLLEVYWKGIYTSSVKLQHHPAEECISIPIGMIEKVSISRSERKKKASEAMIRNRQSCMYEINISIANMSSEELSLEVFDQVPVSRDQAITVEVINCDYAEKNRHTGELCWKLNLKARENKTIHAEYRILWPKDKEIETVEERQSVLHEVINPFSSDMWE